MIQKTKEATEQSLEQMFAHRQMNQALSTPSQNGVVSASDMLTAGMQATQNAIALNQQANQHQIIQTQNAMMVAKEAMLQIRSVTDSGDGGGEVEFTIYE